MDDANEVDKVDKNDEINKVYGEDKINEIYEIDGINGDNYKLNENYINKYNEDIITNILMFNWSIIIWFNNT